MTIYYQDDHVRLHHGDCLDVLATLPDESVHAVVTDPPYGIRFMGRAWDGADIVAKTAQRQSQADMPDDGKAGANGGYRSASTEAGRYDLTANAAFGQWCEAWARECLRVLKPGGHMLAFGGMRTQHRLACAIEDAGFEIRDAITWLYGQGFPKSLNVTAALDRIVPADARCACGQRSTRTAQGSQDGYPSSHGSDDGRPHHDAAGGQSPSPSRDGAPAHSRDGQPRDGRGEALASSGPDVESAPPSTAGSPHHSARPAGESPSSAGAQSDTETSTSAAPGQAPHRTAAHTQCTSGLAAGSASSASWRNKHMSCPECGGFDTPQGLGTALKPAAEIIVVARKPLSGTVAGNVLAHGTGALNIDGCRIPGQWTTWQVQQAKPLSPNSPGRDSVGWGNAYVSEQHPDGRWPANVVLDASQAAALDAQSGELQSGGLKPYRDNHQNASSYHLGVREKTYTSEPNSGGASRFFPTFRYEAKAGASERPRYNKSVLRLRADLTPKQVDHVRARLAEAGVQVD